MSTSRRDKCDTYGEVRGLASRRSSHLYPSAPCWRRRCTLLPKLASVWSTSPILEVQAQDLEQRDCNLVSRYDTPCLRSPNHPCGASILPGKVGWGTWASGCCSSPSWQEMSGRPRSRTLMRRSCWIIHTCDNGGVGHFGMAFAIIALL